jgi:two-component system sensor histidine kinase RegB
VSDAACGAEGTALRAARVLSGIDVSRPLVWLRWVAVLASALTVMVVHYALAIELPLGPLGVVIALYSLWSLGVHWWQVHAGAPGHAVLTLLLSGDALALSALLYFTGGWTNPVVSLYLVPVAVGAAVLPVRNALVVALSCGAAYSCLTVWYVPLPSVDERFGGDFNLHIAGMWINFLVASVLVTVSVAVLAQRIRKMDQALMRARERQLRDEHIVALGTLAAGAAHELSTPLNTLRLLVDELGQADQVEGERNDSLALARRQLDLMRDRLRLLRADTRQLGTEWAARMPLREFVDLTVDRWRASRPDVLVEIDWPEAFSHSEVVVDEAVSQAMASILNNAADASQGAGVNRIAVSPEFQPDHVIVAVSDWGPGLDETVRGELGQGFASTKVSGHGIGLVLSHAALERHGGSIRYRSNAEGGSTVSLVLPVAPAPDRADDRVRQELTA